MSHVASEIRRSRKEDVRLNRKLALQRIPGKVAERDPDTRQVRLDIGADPGTGNTVLSPWVRVQSLSAGAFRASVLPSIGEQMYLESASGVVGADSLATFGAFDDDHPRPGGGPDDLVVSNGDVQLILNAQGITLRKGDQGFAISDAGLQMLGKFLAKGGSRPASYKGGVDTRGDANVDGNPDVLI